VKVGVVVFPGSNCDRDMYHVLTDVFHLDAEYYWHEKGLPENIDAVILPGGFSYGDRLRAGVIAAHSPIIKDVQKMAEKGIPVLGVCNGFQILVESGLLPGVLLKNESLNFMCEWTNLIVENNKTPFTNQFKLNEKIPIPIANGEGRYYVDDDTMKELKKKNQIVFRYSEVVVDDDTMKELKKKNQIVFRYSEVVNGSSDRIAGVCNEDGNVVGMMPHPERAVESEINPIDNKPSSLIFESLLTKMGVNK